MAKRSTRENRKFPGIFGCTSVENRGCAPLPRFDVMAATVHPPILPNGPASDLDHRLNRFHGHWRKPLRIFPAAVRCAVYRVLPAARNRRDAKTQRVRVGALTVRLFLVITFC